MVLLYVQEVLYSNLLYKKGHYFLDRQYELLFNQTQLTAQDKSSIRIIIIMLAGSWKPNDICLNIMNRFN